LKGGGSVESDLSDLELLLVCQFSEAYGMKEPFPTDKISI